MRNNYPLEAKWLRGASRYNNGATRFGKKYQIRLVMKWANDLKQEDPKIREQRKFWGASEIHDFIADAPHILESINW